MEDKLLSSTLKNYRKKEIDTLQEYLIQISNLKDKPEVLLYNFARFIRTQELTKFLVFDKIFNKILKIHGDIVEFGIHNGNTLFSLAHLSEIYEHRNYTRSIIGVDPLGDYKLPNGKIIGHEKSINIEESIAIFNKSISFDQFDKIRLIKDSFIEGTKNLLKEEQFICALAVMHIGLYKEEKFIIEKLWPRIPKGGVIVFGSLNSKDTPDCTKALLDTIGLNVQKLERFNFSTKYSYMVKK